jgi:uncharacterized protein (TIGR03086 family)
MAQASGSENIRLYRETAEWTGAIIDQIKPDQLNNPTPCTEWDVQALLNHMVGATAMYIATISGTEVNRPTEAVGKSDFVAGAKKVLELAEVPGATERIVTTRRGDLTVREFLENSFVDALAHGWDLAIATNQDPTIPEHLAQACYDRWLPKIENSRGRAFGAEVVVAENASIQSKLLGILGRQG